MIFDYRPAGKPSKKDECNLLSSVAYTPRIYLKMVILIIGQLFNVCPGQQQKVYLFITSVNIDDSRRILVV